MEHVFLLNFTILSYNVNNPKETPLKPSKLTPTFITAAHVQLG